MPNASVTALKRKIAWQSDSKDYHQAMLQNQPLTRDLLGTPQAATDRSYCVAHPDLKLRAIFLPQLPKC